MENNNSNNYTYQYTAPQKPKKERRNRGFGWIIALAICFALLGGVIGGGLVWGVSHSSTAVENGGTSSSTTTIQQGKHTTTTINVNEIDTTKVMTPAEVYAKYVNSTVGITSTVTSTNAWGQTSSSTASGSGFILTEDGYIVTNYHVVEGGTNIKVSTYDGTSYDATIIDYDDGNDLAVLKVNATGFTPVVLGSSSNLNVGDTVLAIGNPLGELTFSLTSGIVSALDREITFSDGSVMDLIQTDCAINSGNSGGALFNLYGEVIGITNAKYSGSSSSGASIDNIAFAIPIDSIRSIVESIIENGYYVKPYIGVTVIDVTTSVQSYYGIPAGALVREVTSGGPAETAGIKQSDVITAVNGTNITGSAALKRAIAKCKVGDTLELTIWRQNSTLTVTVTIGETQSQNATKS